MRGEPRHHVAGSLRLVGVGAAVFALAYLCLIVPRGAERVAPIWLPNALVLTLLLTSRRARWPWLVAASFGGGLLANLAIGHDLARAVGLAMSNALEYVIAAHLLVRVLGRTPDMSRPQNVARYAGLTAAAVVAAAVPATLVLGGFGAADGPANFLTWAMADFAGLLIVTPCCLELIRSRDRGRRFLGPDGLALAALIAVALGTFLQTRYPLLYLVPAALLLTTWRLGLAGAAAGLLSTLGIAMACTVYGRGPFAGIDGSVGEQMLSLQLFLAVCFLMSVPVAVQATRARQLKAELAGALAKAQADGRKVGMAQSVARLGYWRLDLATGEIAWSDEMYRIMGLTPGEPITRELILDRVHPEDREAWRARFDRALADGEPYEQEVLRLVPGDGELRYVRARVVLERGEAGELVAVFGIMFDNTETIRGQLARQEAETRFSLIAEHAHDIIVRADMTGRVLYISPSCRILGYEPAELVGRDAFGLLHPEDAGRFMDNTRRLLSGEAIPPGLDRQHRYRRRDGAYLWLEGNPTIVRDAEGRPSELLNLFRDVTARKLAEIALAEKDAELEFVADHAPDLLVRIDADDRIAYASGSSRIFGYEPHELVGRLRRELVHPDDFRSFDAIRDRTRDGDTRTPQERQYRLIRGDGSWVWVEGILSQVHDAEGTMIGAIALVRDITERRAAEAALADSETRYRTLAENVSDILVRFGPDGRIRYISEACRKIGLDPQAAIGADILNIVAPGSAGRAREILQSLFSGAEVDRTTRRQHRVVTPDGRELWLEGSPQLVRDAQGAVIEVVSVYRDVTARRAAEISLAESEARFRLLAENARDLVMDSNPDGTLAYISPSCLAMTGYAPDEVVGQTALRWVHPDDRATVIGAFQDQLVSKGAADLRAIEYRLITRSGREIWMESAPRAKLDPQTGEVVSITDSGRDVTVRKVLEASLSEARDAAESAAQVKADFMANMSHEIRTPLTALLGFTSMLKKRSDLHAEARRQVDRVSGAGEALLTIVNDVLDFSKLEAGLMPLKLRAADITGTLSEALALFEPQAAAKGLTLTFEGPEGLPQAQIDPDRLRQVLLNLIGNAVKFTQAGGVTLHAAYDATRERLSVEIVDTGPGMDEAQQAALFQRFSQVDAASTRHAGGTGLGLAICRGLVEAMGGEIGVRSAPGRGSTFWFQIQAPAAQAVAPENDEPLSFPVGIRLLVADDNAINRELVRALLTPLGVEVTEASDGAEAMALAATEPFDVILMDMRMPHCDGPEATLRIRDGHGPNDQIPILAFSADYDLDRYGEQVSQRFDGLVRKPIDKDDMIAQIARHATFDLVD